MIESKTSSIRISIMQSLYWAAFCVLFGFLVPLFKEWGYSNLAIGIMMTAISLTSMAAQPVWGLLCDARGYIREVFILAMAAACLIASVLPLGAYGVPVAAALLILLSVTAQSMSPVIDAWTMGLINDGVKINFSVTRSFGSLSYALTAAGFGILLDRFGSRIRVPAFIGLTIVLILLSLSLKSPVHTFTARHLVEERNVLQILFHNRKYRIFILANILVYIGYGSLNAFYPVLLAQLGGTNADLGIGFFIMGISQVPGMLLFNVLRRSHWFRAHTALAVSLFFFSIKGIVIALAPNVAVALWAQALEAFSYGIFLPSAIGYIYEIVDRKSIISAQMIFSAASYGLGATAGSLAAGILSEFLRIADVILVISLASLSGGLLLTFSLLQKSSKKIIESSRTPV